MRAGYEAIRRGVELIDMKMKCIEVIKELDIPTVIVPTVSKGDNSDELFVIIGITGITEMELDAISRKWRELPLEVLPVF